MRRLLLTAVVALTGGSAMASSIEYVNGTHTSNGSFVRLDCARCQPVKDNPAPEGFAIPSIEPGTQHTEMREIEGKRTLVRTEAWLGGAPVTFVPRDSQRFTSLHRGPGRIGDDRDTRLQPRRVPVPFDGDDALHARHGERGGGIDAGGAAAVDRAFLDDRVGFLGAVEDLPISLAIRPCALEHVPHRFVFVANPRVWLLADVFLCRKTVANIPAWPCHIFALRHLHWRSASSWRPLESALPPR